MEEQVVPYMPDDELAAYNELLQGKLAIIRTYPPNNKGSEVMAKGIIRKIRIVKSRPDFKLIVKMSETRWWPYVELKNMKIFNDGCY